MGTGVVVAAPVALSVAGFSAVGPAVGSYAASWMSATAVASGGGVPAGGIYACLQASGMVGVLSAKSVALGAAAGAGAGAAAKIGKDGATASAGRVSSFSSTSITHVY